MLKLSRISRSIVVVAYAIFMCFVIYLAAVEKSIDSAGVMHIFIYVVSVILCVCFYQIIKRRLRAKIDSQLARRIYRFGYLAVVLIVSRILMIYFLRDSVLIASEYNGLSGLVLRGIVNITGEEKYAAVIINTILVYVNSIIIKKIMLNVIDNDAVSTMSSIIYILSPISLATCLKFDNSIFNTLFVLLGMLVLYKIYDEISEYGLKGKKYIVLSCILGIICALDVVFGGNFLTWVAICTVLILVTDYIEKDSFIFRGKKIVISKGIAVICIVAIFGIISCGIADVFGLNIYSWGKSIPLFGITKKMYILSGIVVVLFEVLGIALKRKSSSKPAFTKFATLIFGIFAIYFNQSLLVFDALFSISFILSLSNMYYDREEKIKLLKSVM